jgi:hypothetical protein
MESMTRRQIIGLSATGVVGLGLPVSAQQDEDRPDKPIDPSLGLDLGDQWSQATREGIVVRRELLVEIGTTSIIRASSCRVDDPNYVRVRASVTPPGKPERTFLSINNRELFPGNHCLGDHIKTKQGRPLGPERGTYLITLYGIAAQINMILSVVAYPSIRMWADGVKVVDISYTPPGSGVMNIKDSWFVTLR